jgi:neutral ceramidase
MLINYYFLFIKQKIMSDKIKAGVDRIIINPPLGTYLIGYANRKGGAKNIHDNLTATTLVLSENSENIFALVSLDLLALNWEIVRRIKDRINETTKIPINNIRLFCSHTHSGPVGWAHSKIKFKDRVSEFINKLKLLTVEPFKTKGIRSNKLYYDNLINNLSDSVKHALDSMVDVHIEHAKTDAEFSINRRKHLNPDNCIDKEIHLIKFISGQKTIASIINYACHNVALGPNSNVISADIAGEMRSRVEEKIGGKSLFIQGAAADINPNVEWGKNSIRDIEKIGKTISDAVLSAAVSMKIVKSTPIKSVVDRVKAYIDIPENIDNKELKNIPKIMIDKQAKIPKWIVYPMLSIRFPWKTELLKDENGYYTPIDIGVLKIGDILITSISMEPFAETGLEIKKYADFPIVIFAGYCDGLTGYLPTSKDSEIGGYEIELVPYFYKLPGPYKKNTEEVVVKRIKQLIQKL